MYIVTIRIKDLETNMESNEVNVEDIIFHQHDIEFEFEDGTSLPYSDFLFYKDDYQVIIKILG